MQIALFSILGQQVDNLPLKQFELILGRNKQRKSMKISKPVFIIRQKGIKKWEDLTVIEKF